MLQPINGKGMTAATSSRQGSHFLLRIVESVSVLHLKRYVLHGKYGCNEIELCQGSRARAKDMPLVIWCQTWVVCVIQHQYRAERYGPLHMAEHIFLEAQA